MSIKGKSGNLLEIVAGNLEVTIFVTDIFGQSNQVTLCPKGVSMLKSQLNRKVLESYVRGEISERKAVNSRASKKTYRVKRGRNKRKILST